MPQFALALILLAPAPAADGVVPPPAPAVVATVGVATPTSVPSALAPNAVEIQPAAPLQSGAAASIADTPAPGTPTLSDTLDPAAALPPAPDPAAAASDLDGVDTIVVSGKHETPREDPLEGVNFQSYEAVQAVDRAIVAPVAMGYKHAVPKPVRHGIRNLINNLDEPVVALNFLLQLKPGKAAETLGRFAINSTLGLGGLIDVAKKKPFNLPRRYNGLANTLGYYGIGPGPFLFLPGIGPTTVRDLVGRVVDFSLVPRIVGSPLTKPEVSISKATLSAIGDRIADDKRIRELRDQSDDGYGAIRKNYLERRQTEIDALRGRSNPTTDATPQAAPPPQPANDIDP